MRERIVDIGIGEGGKYLNQESEAIVIGIDRDMRRLKDVLQQYPHVLAINADAKALPLQSESIDRLRCIFPFDKLLIEGLQPPLPSLSQEGWYPEFARVLKPQGSFHIIGDYFVLPSKIRKHSKDYFYPQSVKLLDATDLLELDTPEAVWNASWTDTNHTRSQVTRNMWKEIHLRKK